MCAAEALALRPWGPGFRAYASELWLKGVRA